MHSTQRSARKQSTALEMSNSSVRIILQLDLSFCFENIAVLKQCKRNEIAAIPLSLLRKVWPITQRRKMLLLCAYNKYAKNMGDLYECGRTPLEGRHIPKVKIVI